MDQRDYYKTTEPILNVGITRDGIKFLVVTNVKNEKEEEQFRREIVKKIEKELMKIDAMLKGQDSSDYESGEVISNLRKQLNEIKDILKK